MSESPLQRRLAEAGQRLGEREAGYEGRLRGLYLPRGEGQGGFGFNREPDPNMTLDYRFKTQLFWIVSRTNTCVSAAASAGRCRTETSC